VSSHPSFDHAEIARLTRSIVGNKTQPLAGVVAESDGNSTECESREFRLGRDERARSFGLFAVDRVSPGEFKRSVEARSIGVAQAEDPVKQPGSRDFDGVEEGTFFFLDGESCSRTRKNLRRQPQATHSARAAPNDEGDTFAKTQRLRAVSETALAGTFVGGGGFDGQRVSHFRADLQALGQSPHELALARICALAIDSVPGIGVFMVAHDVKTRTQVAVLIFASFLLCSCASPARNLATARAPSTASGVNGCLVSANAPLAEIRSAYPTSYEQAFGDGWIYIAWVWRETPDVSTNHSPSLIRSRDLIHWENMCGQALSLPITLNDPVMVANVGQNQGLLNNIQLAFDAQKDPVLTFQQYLTTAQGPTTQVYDSRWNGTQFVTSQLTQWNTQMACSGEGSNPCPVQADSISFGALQLLSDGELGQHFQRASADATGIPSSGTWVIDDGGNGSLTLSGAQATATELASADPYESPLPAVPVSLVPVEHGKINPNDASSKPFSAHVLYSNSQSHWFSLWGDYLGNGENSRGVFDAFNSVFYLEAGSAINTIQFGNQGTFYYPMIGDWSGSGAQTIGVYNPLTQAGFLKDSLAGGKADHSFVKYPGAYTPADGPLVWNSVDPHRVYAIKWETLPDNSDFAYDCNGDPLGSYNGCTDNSLFTVNLYLLELDSASHQWTKTFLDSAWGGGNGSFDFWTFKNTQVVAYYDQNKHIKLAERTLPSGTWTFQALPSAYGGFGGGNGGWDGHNNLAIAFDDTGTLHLSGNMHDAPLVYYRSSAGLDITKMKAINTMTGQNETSTTYPYFFRGPKGQFLFQYRSGQSGAGNTLVNIYDQDSGVWSPFLTTPIFSGN